MKLPKTFWSRVEPRNKCLLWTGTTTKDGYAMSIIKGERIPAHRAAYANYHKLNINEVSQLYNTCNHRNCVNALHWSTIESQIMNQLTRSNN